MQAVILLAGSGSRLKQKNLAHKSLLEIGNETLLSRHLTSLQELGIERVHLILGHNADHLKNYVHRLNLSIPINFVDNPVYDTTGNTLSVVLGLREFQDDALIMDGDVLYPRKVFYDYVRNSPSSTFAIVPVHIENEEAAKVILREDGSIKAFVSKRGLTDEEVSRYEFSGEAVGFFKFSASDCKTFLKLYQANEPEYIETLWEIAFTDLAHKVKLLPWQLKEEGCYEIDTQTDYEHALKHFNEARDFYG
jgi:choline kinase